MEAVGSAADTRASAAPRSRSRDDVDGRRCMRLTAHSARARPARIFIVVLLPAPFEPTSKRDFARLERAATCRAGPPCGRSFWSDSPRRSFGCFAAVEGDARNRCARMFQNRQVSGAGSSIELMPGMRGALMGEAQQSDRRTFGEKCDRREIAPQNAEEIELAMRQIVHAIVIEIELGRAVPVIADAVDGPLVAGPVRARRFRPDGGCARKRFR